MREHLEGFITSLFEKKVILGVYKIEYKGRGVSTNQYYNSGHWTARHALKSKYKKLLNPIIEDSDIFGKKFDRFGVQMFFNSRHDTDNTVGFEKILTDIMKDEFGIIEEDNKKHFKWLSIAPDLELENNTFQFYILDYGSN